MNPLICTAIKQQRLIELFYECGYRLVEPHVYGLNSNGHELLRAYQTAGASRSRVCPGWKLFHVDQVRALRLLNVIFPGPRPDYKRDDPVMDQSLYCQL